ncbi:hypothetical protein [Methanobrevibacter sp.]|uniref:hypothetical protein n=1 Tax=Methanobrevibacter sp. TaxID=66852 RepID=UPI0025E5EA15|nr:hypothetical protein [Methanobrevibacter sp.]MBQ2666303.1 hypothetical protein [Methanobrevibacter sp.]
MDKNEIIFFAIVIIAYLICTFTLDIPSYVHIIFGILLLIVLLIAMILKYKPQFENDRISRIFDVLSIIILILYVLSTMSELWWGRTFIVDSGIFLISFLVVLAATWFFRKNKNY